MRLVYALIYVDIRICSCYGVGTFNPLSGKSWLASVHKIVALENIRNMESVYHKKLQYFSESVTR